MYLNPSTKTLHMRVLSVWAFHHKKAARLCFVFIYLVLNLVCLFFNEVLLAQNIEVPLFISYFICFIFLGAVLLYPSRKEKSRYKNFYRIQKSMDGLLFLLSFFLIIFSMNASSYGKLSSTTGSVWATELPGKPGKTHYTFKAKTKTAVFIVKHWKQLKDNYRLLRKAYRDTSKGEKAVSIILASIVALGLLFLVLALSCSLACSGAEGGAIVVALLGSALVIFLLVKVIQSINRGPKKPKPVESQTGQL